MQSMLNFRKNRNSLRSSFQIAPHVSLFVSHRHVTFIGPLGRHTYNVNPAFVVCVSGKILELRLRPFSQRSVLLSSRSLVKIAQAQLQKAMWGVAGGFYVTLEIHGRGWRAARKSTELFLRTNYSHIVVTLFPPR